MIDIDEIWEGNSRQYGIAFVVPGAAAGTVPLLTKIGAGVGAAGKIIGGIGKVIGGLFGKKKKVTVCVDFCGGQIIGQTTKGCFDDFPGSIPQDKYTNPSERIDYIQKHAYIPCPIDAALGIVSPDQVPILKQQKIQTILVVAGAAGVMLFSFGYLFRKRRKRRRR